MPDPDLARINDRLAVEVMGWEQRWCVDDDERDHWVSINKGAKGTSDDPLETFQRLLSDWSPTTNANQAVECAEAYADRRPKLYLEVYRWEKEWCVGSSEAAIPGMKSFPLALCQAILAAVDAEASDE